MTRTDRVRALVLYAAVASGIEALEEQGVERVAEEVEEAIEETLSTWGTGAAIEQVAPSRADDVRLRAWFGRLSRLSQSPGRDARAVAQHRLLRRARPSSATSACRR